jgi:hypothetical protein
VPPFISIRAELRSADGGRYALRFGGRTLRVGGEISARSILLEGLRTGDAIAGERVGGGNSVRIEASAEPGP